MKTTAKKRAKNAPRKAARTVHKSAKTSNAAVIIRQMGDEWAEHWKRSSRQRGFTKGKLIYVAKKDF